MKAFLVLIIATLAMLGLHASIFNGLVQFHDLSQGLWVLFTFIAVAMLACIVGLLNRTLTDRAMMPIFSVLYPALALLVGFSKKGTLRALFSDWRRGVHIVASLPFYLIVFYVSSYHTTWWRTLAIAAGVAVFQVGACALMPRKAPVESCS